MSLGADPQLAINASHAALFTACALLPAAHAVCDPPTIQPLLSAASPGDVIELPDGVYSGEGNVNLSFEGKALTLRSASGDPAACVIDCNALPGTQVQGFLFTHSEGTDAVIEGITIRRAWTGNYGGAIYCYKGASPTIRNCVLRQNQAAKGAAIGCISGGSVVVEDCEFYGNTAELGGDFYSRGAGNASFTGCHFHDNVADADPGAGGAAYLDGGSQSFIDCTFEDCLASGGPAKGGAVCCRNGTTASFTDCVFRSNASTGDASGGAAYALEASPTFSGCLFVGNEAALDGGAFSGVDAEAVFFSCTFSNNESIQGGASRCCGESVVLFEGCTFSANHSFGAGGCLSMGCSAGFTLSHCLIVASEGAPVIDNTGSAVIGLTCCNLYGNEGGDWVGVIEDQAEVGGNLSVDPQLCSPVPDEHENWTLQSDSPCLAPACGPIGAWGAGCADTPARSTSWGAIKAAYR